MVALIHLLARSRWVNYKPRACPLLRLSMELVVEIFWIEEKDPLSFRDLLERELKIFELN